jgi:hypothetical protein
MLGSARAVPASDFFIDPLKNSALKAQELFRDSSYIFTS